MRRNPKAAEPDNQATAVTDPGFGLSKGAPSSERTDLALKSQTNHHLFDGLKCVLLN